jgi:hypothetical protein
LQSAWAFLVDAKRRLPVAALEVSLEEARFLWQKVFIVFGEYMVL